MDSRIHILAVDDSHLDRKVVERLLLNSSYKVTTVDSAVRALEVLGVVGTTAPVVINAVKINLIITDYCMPEMTGYDLLKKVKESSALKEIPVVIMSSENVAERITMCLAEGAKEFILKPLRAADVKRLRTHVKHEDEDGDLLIDGCTALKRKPVVAPALGNEQPNPVKRPRRTTDLTDADTNSSRRTTDLTDADTNSSRTKEEPRLSTEKSLREVLETDVRDLSEVSETNITRSSTEFRKVLVSLEKEDSTSREDDQTNGTSVREENESNTACSS